jgi:hypothetical protein
VGDLVKFPIHKIRKPKTDLATKQTKEKENRNNCQTLASWYNY